MDNSINTIFEEIRTLIENDDASREKVLKLSRSAVRKSSEAIRAIHRRELELASSIIESIKSDLHEIISTIPGNGLFENNIEIAFQEFIEAYELFHFVSNRSISESNPLISLLEIQKELPIPYVAYLHGLCDLVGELRRFTLDSIRLNDLSTAEAALQVMDDIFGQLVTLDYPNALVPGIRRKTDLIRNLLERTRGDLTFTFNRLALVTKLDEVLSVTKVDKKDLSSLFLGNPDDSSLEEEKDEN